jgi:ureidoacrylate peracid hydrolase
MAIVKLPPIEPRNAALLVVDMQNGFCDREGDLGRRGQGEPLRAVVPNVGRLVDVFHSAGFEVFWSRQEHELEDATRQNRLLESHFQKQRHLPCLRGTWDAEIEGSLAARLGSDDYVFVKHRASCFYASTLDVALRMRGIQLLVVCGVTTNYCVDSTVRDGYARDYDMIVVRDCCAALYPDLHDASLRNVDQYHGVTATLAEVSEAVARGSGVDPSTGSA